MRLSSRSEGRRSPGPRAGFTLVELLVVILIVVLLSAATLPAILPALNSRRVSEASRLVQAEISRQRDLAVRSNSPRGVRLLPDPIDSSRPNVLTCSRLIAIEPGPDYDDGVVKRFFDFPPYAGTPPDGFQFYPPPAALPPYILGNGITFSQSASNTQLTYPYLVVRQSKGSIQFGVPLPNPPTSWFFNIRQGEKFRLSDSGQVYTIAGPVAHPTPGQNLLDPNQTVTSVLNPERYINFGTANFSTMAADGTFEFLFLMNNNDDDGDGFIDEGFDGVDNDNDGIIDPGFNGRDDDGNGTIDDAAELYLHATGPNGTGPFVYPGNPFGMADGGFPAFINGAKNTNPLPNEYEEEVFVKPRSSLTSGYTINRRPVPVEGSREVLLPTNVVIDLTTWNAGQPERSRLPVDPITGFVDVMVSPNGQLVVAGASANNSPPVQFPFYHFWFTERDDVYEPFGTTANPSPNPPPPPPLLPMPRGTKGDPRINAGAVYPDSLPALKGERRLLSINTRSGVITPTSVETLYVNNTSYPYEAAESGAKESQ